MELIFNLHWLRERGRDLGTPLRADELEPAIRERVLLAAEGAEGELALKLPFLDQRETRRRSEVLSELQFQRCGNEISALLTPIFALRTAAAELAMCHPVWTNAPADHDWTYFRTWQRVSRSLQLALRGWIPREHFRDPQDYADRDAAYPWIVYEAARIYHGNAPQDFTYDLRDFPACQDTLESSWIRIGSSIQKVLAPIEKRLLDAGLPALARRYAPRWHEDILLEVQRRPARLFKLIAAETDLIDAIIDLGTSRSPAAVCRFARIANLRLRNLHGRDVRHLAIDALHETTRVLASAARVTYPSFQNNSASDLRT
jgi:hypothetical protein